MKPQQQKILAQLSKEKSVKGLTKVSLSKINEIEEQVSLAYAMVEEFEQEFEKYQESYGRARDILKFDADDAATYAEDLLEDVLQDLKELGVDMPPKVKQAQQEIADVQNMIKDGQRRLESF